MGVSSRLGRACAALCVALGVLSSFASNASAGDTVGDAAVHAAVAASSASPPALALPASAELSAPAQLAQSGQAQVLVEFADGHGPQDVALRDDLTLVDDYPAVGAALYNATSTDALDVLNTAEAVTAVRPDGFISPTLAEAKALVRQPAAASAGATGAGKTIVVLDTGISPLEFDSDCVSVPAPNCSVSAVYELPGVPAAPVPGYSTPGPADGALNDDPHDHGSSVTGSALATAPAAKVIFVDVYAMYSCSSASCPYGTSFLSSTDAMITAGLDLAVSLRHSDPTISIVNLSAGTNSTYGPGECDTTLAAAFSATGDSGITSFVSAGNGGDKSALSSPACLSGMLDGVVSVGATYDVAGGTRSCLGNNEPAGVDVPTCYSNSSSELTVLAPGSFISVAGHVVEGTSFSAPIAAGAAASLAGAVPAATPRGIKYALGHSGPAVTEPLSGQLTRRLDMVDALVALHAAPSGPTRPGLVGITPVRVFDTRPAPYGPINSPAVPISPAGRTFALAGLLGTSDVSAVALNITGIAPSVDCYLSVWPAGQSQPYVSNLNLSARATLANSLIVGTGATNALSVASSCPAVDVAIDVTGYFPADSDLVALAPQRIVDSRIGLAISGPTSRPVAVNAAAALGLPASMIDSVLVNITATNPTEAAYLTVFPNGFPAPYTSALNFSATETASSFHIAKLGADGSFVISPSNGRTDLVVDIFAYVPAGAASFTADTGYRVLDTRSGFGVCSPACSGPAGGGSLSFTVGSVPAGTGSVALKVTATGATAQTYLTLFPSDATLPNASNLYVVPGDTLTNLVVVKLGPANTVRLFNAAGSAGVVADVVGFFPG